MSNSLLTLAILVVLLAVCTNAFTRSSLLVSHRRLDRGVAARPVWSALYVSDPVKDFEASWGQKRIYVAEGLQHKEFPSNCGSVRGLGLSSKAGVAQNEAIVKLPVSEIMVVSEKASASCEELETKISDELWSSMQGTTRLSCLLLEEFSKGRESRFYEYIQHFPEPGALNTPVHWQQDGLALTVLSEVYPHMTISVAKQRAQYKKLYELLSSSAGSASGSNAVITNESFERFVWAMESVSARAFRGIAGLKGRGLIQGGIVLAAASVSMAVVVANYWQSEQRESLSTALSTVGALGLLPAIFTDSQTTSSCVLLPVIDSCNHKGTAPAAEVAFEVTEDAFVVRSKKSIPAGKAGQENKEKEVTLSYGDRDNDDLLQYFGFVEQNNEFDLYRFKNGDMGSEISISRGPKSGWELGLLSEGRLKGLLEQQVLEMEKGVEQLVAEGGGDSALGLEEKLCAVFLEEKVKIAKAALDRI